MFIWRVLEQLLSKSEKKETVSSAACPKNNYFYVGDKNVYSNNKSFIFFSQDTGHTFLFPFMILNPSLLDNQCKSHTVYIGISPV